MEFTGLKYLVVGAGLFGSTIAERIATQLNEKVVVVDKRDHYGGNCHSQIDSESGIEYHTYGTHIFHTSNYLVWKYMSMFTNFNGYFHQSLAMYNGRIYQLPINLETINTFFKVNLTPNEVDIFLKDEIVNIPNPQNLEEKALATVGQSLYKAFILGYTRKQWGKHPRDLPASTIERLPVRKNYNENYFFDKWQGEPEDGYSNIFQAMLDRPNIDVVLNTDFFDIKDKIPEDCSIIYTGAIDAYFNYKYGELEYRSLELDKHVVRVEDYQGVSIMNHTDYNVRYVRTHEPRHLYPERNYTKEKTLIFREYSKGACNHDNLTYPVNTEATHKVYEMYAEEVKKSKNVLFGGRLGDYKYYDMDDTIAKALGMYHDRIWKIK